MNNPSIIVVNGIDTLRRVTINCLKILGAKKLFEASTLGEGEDIAQNISGPVLVIIELMSTLSSEDEFGYLMDLPGYKTLISSKIILTSELPQSQLKTLGPELDSACCITKTFIFEEFSKSLEGAIQSLFPGFSSITNPAPSNSPQ